MKALRDFLAFHVSTYALNEMAWNFKLWGQRLQKNVCQRRVLIISEFCTEKDLEILTPVVFYTGV